jgi:hypothetical protein
MKINKKKKQKLRFAPKFMKISILKMADDALTEVPKFK